jgi:ribosome-associated protein
MREVTISDDMIRLGQFLKLADVIDAGSDVKQLLGSDDVAVNGEPENRRGRQLFRGDIVTVGDDISLVVA